MKAELEYPVNSIHEIVEENNLPFSASDFSLFKFGRTDIAKKYAIDLFLYFRNNFKNKYYNKHIILYPSPYTEIPTASYYFTKCLYDLLVENSVELNIRSCCLGKIERCQTYTVDYGNLSFIERYNLIKNDTYQLHEEPNNESVLVFVDDISITGSHQLVLENLLSNNQLSNEVVFLYFAKLSNSEIPPQIENALNYANINSTKDLINLCSHESFQMTTRFVKYILRLESSSFLPFIENLKSSLINEIIIAAKSNNYEGIVEYEVNFDYLLNIVQQKNNIPSSVSHN